MVLNSTASSFFPSGKERRSLPPRIDSVKANKLRMRFLCAGGIPETSPAGQTVAQFPEVAVSDSESRVEKAMDAVRLAPNKIMKLYK